MNDYIEAKNAAGYIKRTSVSQITFRSNVIAALNNDPSVGNLGSYETDWLDGATPELIAFHLEWLRDCGAECYKAGDFESAAFFSNLRLIIEKELARARREAKDSSDR
jgi:hypothetical protein